MITSSQIQERMEVVGSDGGHVGVVDHIEAGRIKLAKSDPLAKGQHHYIELADVERIDGNRVCLRATAHEAIHRWQAARQYSGD